MSGIHVMYDYAPLFPPDSYYWNGDECVHEEDSDAFEQCGPCDWAGQCDREFHKYQQDYADYRQELAEQAADDERCGL
jgi:hypothetical protein